MKITQVEAIPFAIPYRKPLRFASGEVHVAEHVLVRVTTDEGVVGVAEAPPRPFTYGETQAGIVAVIDSIFSHQVLGMGLMERERRGEAELGAPSRQVERDALEIAVGRLDPRRPQHGLALVLAAVFPARLVVGRVVRRCDGAAHGLSGLAQQKLSRKAS